MTSTEAKPKRDEPSGLTPHGRVQRETLVRAAFDLIAEEGFERLRTRDVAARAGVNIATLHYYFPTKEDLIRGVGAYVHELVSVTYGSRLYPSDKELSPLEALRHELDDDEITLREEPAVFAVLSELYIRARRDPMIAQITRELDANWREHIATIVAAGIALGQFRADLDPNFAALTLTSFMKGALVSALFDANFPLARVAAQLETLLTGKPVAPVS